MRLLHAALCGTAMLALTGAAQAQEKLGEGLVMYFQMGGQPGDGATLPRQNGAKAAAEALGVDVREQFSAWAGETMLNQFREAMAARPDCIQIMGHPGAEAWEPLVAEAEAAGITVTNGNASIDPLYEQYRAQGFGYIGVELYEGGWMTGKAMIEKGNLKDAEIYLNRYMRLGEPTLSALVLGVRIARAQGEKAAEDSMLQQLRRRFPDAPQTRELLGATAK